MIVVLGHGSRDTAAQRKPTNRDQIRSLTKQSDKQRFFQNKSLP